MGNVHCDNEGDNQSLTTMKIYSQHLKNHWPCRATFNPTLYKESFWEGIYGFFK